MTARALRRLSAVLGLMLLLAGPTSTGLTGRAEAAKSGNQKRTLEKKKIAKTKAKAVARRNARKAKAKKGSNASGSLPRPKKADSAGATLVAAVAPAPKAATPKKTTAKKTIAKKKTVAKKTTTAKKTTAAGKDANVPKPEAIAAAASATATPDTTTTAPAADSTNATAATDSSATPATDSTATPATTSPAAGTATAGNTATSTTSTTSAPKKTTAKKSSSKKSKIAPLGMAAAEVTSAQRESKAKSLVSSRLKTKDGPTWDVSTPPLQFVGDRTNPVTGSGPIEVIARQKVQPKGFFGRLKHFFSPNAERKFLVLVDPQGAATIISSEAHGAPYRLLKTVTSKLPLREYISDAVKSKGAKNGAGMAVGGAGVIAATSATGVGLVVGIGLIVRGIQTYQEGIQRRTTARTKAMEKTVADIKTAVDGGQTITLAEAYRIYTRDLSNLEQDGAVTGGSITPATLKEFTEELTTYGL